MVKGKKIAVVVPAYNEEKLIGKVIETMPEFVDFIIVVDDGSTDGTSNVVKKYQDQNKREIILLRHATNRGVGGAIISGHKKALEVGADVVAVMAGDAQMDPSDLPNILEPVINGQCDYSKGNRFINGEAWRKMPRLRFFANAVLSMLNKITSGFWHISDPQCGYTAISSTALRKLNLDAISQGYHFENSMLTELNIHNMKVTDVPIKAIYGIGEKSGINEFVAIFSFTLFLVKAFVQRLYRKYIIRDFHPLVFFYFFGLLSLLAGLGFGLYLIAIRLIMGTIVEATSALFAMLLFLSGLQMVLFGMWFDKDYSSR
ncbi:glycosyltransferase family 2 protein [Thermanaerothrix sp.]|uniref:glycosyltransferase family 2 protein n=1 Tax=Thermanaerothrix sp. TaxID=2972675 RepID=UPI002ADD677B|nr:glycosyltransferase family 2 protein [Thermanaerothrix sp.]